MGVMLAIFSSQSFHLVTLMCIYFGSLAVGLKFGGILDSSCLSDSECTYSGRCVFPDQINSTPAFNDFNESTKGFCFCSRSCEAEIPLRCRSNRHNHCPNNYCDLEKNLCICKSSLLENCAKRNLQIIQFNASQSSPYLGDHVTVVCCINSDPRSTKMRWLHNNSVELRSTKLPDQVLGRCYVLDLHNVQYKDSGLYTCQVYNDAVKAPVENHLPLQVRAPVTLDLRVTSLNSSSVLAQWSISAVPHMGVTLRVETVEHRVVFEKRNIVDEKTVIVDNLKPATRYTVTAATIPFKGGRTALDKAHILTPEDISDSPEIVQSIKGTMGGSKCAVSWRLPKHPNGKILYYEVEFSGSIRRWPQRPNFLASAHEPPSSTPNCARLSRVPVEYASNLCQFDDLLPNRNYSLRVRAVNGAGTSPPAFAADVCATDLAPPTRVPTPIAFKNDDVVKRRDDDVISSAARKYDVIDRNDDVIAKNDDFAARRHDVIGKYDDVIKKNDDVIDKNGDVIGDAVSSRNYDVKSSRNESGFNAKRSPTTPTLTVRFDEAVDESYGPVTCYYLAIVPHNENTQRWKLPESIDVESYENAIKSNLELDKQPKYAYIAESYRFLPKHTVIGDGDEPQDAGHCSVYYLSRYMARDGSLKWGYWYTGFLIARVDPDDTVSHASAYGSRLRRKKSTWHMQPMYSHSDYFKSVYLGNLSLSVTAILHAPSETSSTVAPTNEVQVPTNLVPLTFALICLLFILVLASVISAFILHKRGLLKHWLCFESNFVPHRDSFQELQRLPRDFPPIPVENLVREYKEKHKNSDFLLTVEFEALPHYNFDTVASDKPENSSKNRYNDIKAYDLSRVVLDITNGDPNSDYINANYIKVYKGTKTFIAAQGPMQNTVDDFWRLIYEKGIKLVIMVTNLQERYRQMCIKYWPDQGASGNFGDLRVKALEASYFSDYVIRRFELTKSDYAVPPLVDYAQIESDEIEPLNAQIGSETRAPPSLAATPISAGSSEPHIVLQYHYTAWNDYRAPEGAAVGLLKFLKALRQRPEYNGDGDYGNPSTSTVIGYSNPPTSSNVTGYSNPSTVIGYSNPSACNVNGYSKPPNVTGYGDPSTATVSGYSNPPTGVGHRSPTPLAYGTRRSVAASYSNPFRAPPILVHCSAGVGRTGTLIALDALMDQIVDERRADVFGLVSEMRLQRNFMVQSLEQYVFVYKALTEYYLFGDTDFDAETIGDHVTHLHLPTGDQYGVSNLHREYNKLSETLDDPKSCDIARNRANSAKNRCQNFLPFDRNRVILQPVLGESDASYINASIIKGYFHPYVVTQDPTPDTVWDFWRMIIEQRATCVVCLSDENSLLPEEKYWPTEVGRNVSFGGNPLITVQHYAEESMPNCHVRKLHLTSQKINGEIREIVQFSYADWSIDDQSQLPASTASFLDFIGKVLQKQSCVDNAGPIVVHCKNGSTKSGLYVCVSLLLERLRAEQKIDVFQTVKSLQSQRQGVLPNAEQYEFCYAAVLRYLQSFQ